ncbi:ankyrin-3-like [Branchiostoma floridae]|uniref:Ankyrin-3-like n=1 Tax=Branchiostoma floridae TaxID=7739 RepID=A0A9J7M325_BRAFL|nr:ankyrin-3-like [Branchiostoma floridae]
MSNFKEETEDEHLEGELWLAAGVGDMQNVTRLIQQGVDVNYKGYLDTTPLHSAASGGHVGVAKVLLKAGAQVESTDGSGKTPLHNAATWGHVGVAEFLLKYGARVDSTDRHGETPEDIAASKDVPYGHDKDRILEGRKRILELFAAVKMAGCIVRKVGPEGGKLQTASCTVTVPRGAVTMETQITCQVINPNDVTIPLKDGEMLVSDIIELGPKGTTFNQHVTVQMQYSSASSGGDSEAIIENKLSVLVDHFSIFAVISQPKQDQFNVPTGGWTQASSTQPAVQVKFPKGSVNTETQVTIQVQEVPERAVTKIKAKDESFHGLLSTSPIVTVTVSDSAVQFHKPVTVRVPHPQHYMDIQHDGNTKLRVMSCEEGTEDWVDMTNSTTNIRVTLEYVEFEVSHFSRWIVIVVTDRWEGSEEIGPILLKRLSRWLQHRDVQFILLQREDDANECVVECSQVAEDQDNQARPLREPGYKVAIPSDKVRLFEGQQVEIRLQGNVALTQYGTESSGKPRITFYSRNPNRRHLQVTALKGSDGRGYVALYALPRVEVEKCQNVGRKIGRLRKVAKKDGEQGKTQEMLLYKLTIHVPEKTWESTFTSSKKK